LKISHKKNYPAPLSQVYKLSVFIVEQIRRTKKEKSLFPQIKKNPEEKGIFFVFVLFFYE